MADQKGNSSSENAAGWFILLCVFLALFALFWYFNEFKVKDFIRNVRWGEMWVIAAITGDDYAVPYKQQPLNLDAWVDVVPTIPAEKLDSNTMSAINTMALKPVALPIALILGALGMWCAMFGPGTQYRRKMNLDTLIRAQKDTFPVIAPFLNFNPSTQPPRPPGAPVPADLPVFAEALGPEEWLAYHSIPIPDGQIDRQATYMAFAAQLGPRWAGWEKLPVHKQILLAAFCLKAARKRKDADDMIGRIAKCWTFEKGLNFSKDPKLPREARAILKNSELSGTTLRRVNQHAFQTTAMMRALATAREEGGVMAPATFVWLRAYDRTLWYPLNNLGRQAFHMEAFGAMAHYKSEKQTQRPIPRPKVEPAIESIITYMQSDKARPVPQLDYKGSKKRGIKQPKSSGVKQPKRA